MSIATISKHLDNNNLKSRCARSSILLTFGVVSERGFAFAGKMILTRLLAVEQIGLMVLVLSLTALFEAFTEIGIKQSVIHNKNGSQFEYFNTAWWFQSIRGTCLYVLAFLLAPLICNFYFSGKAEILEASSMKELVLLVRIAFLSIFFNGLINPRIHVLEKELRFFKPVVLIQGSGLIGTAVTIILAFILKNVWAVVIGFVCMSFLRCVFSFFLCPFWPKLTFHRNSFDSLFKYARGMLGTPMLVYLSLNMDILIAGRMVSAELLGMYGMSLTLARMPRELFVCIISPVLLPAFAEKQDHKQSICNAVLKITRFTLVIGGPCAVIAVLFGGNILSLIFGKDYSSMAVPFGLLCVYILLLIQSTTLASVFLGTGQPSKHRIFVGLRVFIIAIAIYPAIQMFGFVGLALVLVLANLIALGIQILIMRKIIGLQIRDYLYSWVPGLLLAGIVAFFGKALQSFDIFGF